MDNILTADCWHGCYGLSWKGFITSASFAHPAKFSRGLIERIFDHCLERGYLRPGDVVGDCFGGIGTGGIIASYRGLQWVGCELEPRFVEMADANFAMHASKLAVLGKPMPRIIQGDSRKFSEIVGVVDVCCSSPPFVQTGVKDHEGQTDALKDGKLKGGGTRFLDADYGSTSGQIGKLKSGSVEAVISSPPFMEQQTGGGLAKPDAKYVSKGKEYGPEHFGRFGKNHGYQNQGDGAGQIGNEKGESYWRAVAQVYASCFQAIRPGGYIVLVVKDFVKQGKRVPLCDDTCQLLEHTGFQSVERIHAMLVKETRHGDLFNGETKDTKSRKSFFRRLAESKGSPKIDYEEVLIFQKSRCRIA